MESLFLYLGKVILTSTILFFYYKLFLKERTFHHYNRFYLLGTIAVSLLLPVLKVSYFTIEVSNDIYLLFTTLNTYNSAKNLNYDFFYYQLTFFFSGLVAVFFILKLMIGLMKIQLLKKKFKREYFEGINFYQTNLEDAPFSFFKNLFWKNSIQIDSDLGRQILKHEMVHIEQKHSWDKIFAEIITSVFWFNPIYYFIKKELYLIHEYLADKKALKNSDTKAFAQMLLASHFSGKMLPATSPFLSSNLKKRLKMLQKSKSKFSYARRIFALPILFALGFIYLVNAKNKEIKMTNEEVAKAISEMKKDTIKPQKLAIGTDGTKLYDEHPDLFIDHDSLNDETLKAIQAEIALKQKALEPYQKVQKAKSEDAQKISKELTKKSTELQKLAEKKDFESPKFKALEKEMELLGSKLDAIYNTADFKNNEKWLEKNYGDLDQLYAKLDQYYNSDAFTSKIKNAELAATEVEKKVNSPEFKKMIKDAEEQGKKAEKMANSTKFKKQIKIIEKKAKETDKKINSPEFQLKIKNIENAVDQDISKTNNDATFYIDGKISTKEEMEKLEPNKIESMHVYKKRFEGKEKGEIHITLKK